MSSVIKYVAYIVGVVCALWASLPEIFQLLLLLMIFDFMIGTIRAIIENTVSGKIRFDGLTKKAVILIVVALAWVLEYYFLRMGYNIPLAVGVAGFYCLNEGISILDNARAIIPLPKILDDALNQVFGKQESE